ncbi:hypothetical protein JKF63_00115 [Porcisia hertigi]|uniref:Uncharacterized protein n=1 Tax=Porcisia hertigi TaxID=2761500 RepID=A0A836KWT3_9TRYP|nr:hypothetical protein JKF63_00115 [Porcisia hertigi]
MRCSVSTPPHAPAMARGSNLQHYRALLQVLSYAAQRELTAEQLVQDAMTGGVVVPFKVLHNADASTIAMKFQTPSCNFRPGAQLGANSCSLHELGSNTMLLLPSSKFIGTTASLLADGFFCFAPLSSTVEKSPGTSYQYRSESQVRDLFTLIMLLFPECFVAETLPRIPSANRDAESWSSQTQLGVRADSEVQDSSFASKGSLFISPPRPALPGIEHTPTARQTRISFTAEHGIVADAGSLHKGKSDRAFSSCGTAALGESPCRLASSVVFTDHSSIGEGDGLGGTPANTSVPPNAVALSIVDAVPLTLDTLDVLLDARRSLAIVLLSHINDALHKVQYRQIEQSHATTPARGAKRLPTCRLLESGVMRYSLEVLLTAKLLLLSTISASAVWRKLFATACENKIVSRGAALSPLHVLMELVGEETTGATPFVSLPVEQWVWGREEDALGRWYDRFLEKLLVGTDRAGVRIDAYLQRAKSDAVRTGCSVSCFPTLLLHRPSDGQPAVEMSIASAPRVSASVRLPSLPVQPGELQVFLCTSALEDKTGLLHARGHELLLDSTSSPTADFFHACASSACAEAQLQPSGDALPWLFRRRLTDLSSTEQGIVAAVLRDPAMLSAVLEKNPAMLARLTLWCRNRWPPPLNPSSLLPKASTQSNNIVVRNENTEEGQSLDAKVEQYVLFHHPFSATVGRYVRELVTLKGLSQELLEAWMQHVCASATADGSASSPHRAMFAALVKFAVLHNRWQLDPKVEALHNEYFT